MVAPVIAELAKDYQGKITFGKLDVDNNQSVAMKYNIMSIPTLLIFKDWQLIDQIVGAMPKNQLEQRLIQYL
jgi:thioredoxin 1